jgi:hypothetical protein
MDRVLALARALIACVLAASVAACALLSSVYETDFDVDVPAGKVGDAYAARDLCLKWTIARIDDGSAEPAEMGKRAARLCRAETDALIAPTDPHGDRVVAGNIRDDSRLRATRFVIEIRRIAVDVRRRSDHQR